MLLLIYSYSNNLTEPWVTILFQHVYHHQERFLWNDKSESKYDSITGVAEFVETNPRYTHICLRNGK